MDGFFPSLVQPQTKKHWHLYGKIASHEGGVTVSEAKPTSPQTYPRVVPPFLLYGLHSPIRLGKHIHSLAMTNVEIFGNL